MNSHTGCFSRTAFLRPLRFSGLERFAGPSSKGWNVASHSHLLATVEAHAQLVLAGWGLLVALRTSSTHSPLGLHLTGSRSYGDQGHSRFA